MAKLSFKQWSGEPPARPEGGKTRQPNPFDEIVLKSYDEKKSFSFDVPHDPEAFDGTEGKTRTDELATYTKQLRSAARYHSKGIDIRVIGDTGIWFAVRDPKPRAKLPNDTPAVDPTPAT